MRTKPIESNKRTVETKDGKAKVKLQKMSECKVLESMSELDLPLTTIPLPGITTEEWQAFEPCLDEASKITDPQNPDQYPLLIEKIKPLVRSKKRAIEVLAVANYLEHQPILDATIELWAEREYAIDEKEDQLAPELDFAIGQKTLALTPLSRKLPKWIIKGMRLEQQTFEQEKQPWSSCANSDDSLLAIGNNAGIITIINRATQQSSTFAAHTDAISDIHFSPDNKWLFSSGRTNGFAIWDVDNNFSLKYQDTTMQTCLMAVSTEGSLLAVNDTDCIVVIDYLRESKTTIPNPCPKAHTVALNASNTLIASNSGTHDVGIWDLTTLERVHVVTTLGTHAIKLQFNADSSLLAACCKNGMIYIWHVPDFRLTATIPAHTQTIWNCAFSDCGRFLFSGSIDKTVKIWDLETHKCIRILKQKDQVFDLRLTHQKELLVATWKNGNTIIKLNNFFECYKDRKKQLARNTVLTQAQFIKRAFDTTADEPLELTDEKNKAIFEAFPKEIKTLLEKNLPLKKAAKKKRKTADEKDEDYIPE